MRPFVLPWLFTNELTGSFVEYGHKMSFSSQCIQCYPITVMWYCYWNVFCAECNDLTEHRTRTWCRWCMSKCRIFYISVFWSVKRNQRRTFPRQVSPRTLLSANKISSHHARCEQAPCVAWVENELAAVFKGAHIGCTLRAIPRWSRGKYCRYEYMEIKNSYGFRFFQRWKILFQVKIVT